MTDLQDLDHWGEIKIGSQDYDFNIFCDLDGEIQATVYQVIDGETDTSAPVFTFKCIEAYF